MMKKRLSLLLMLFFCILPLCSCVSYIPEKAPDSEIWQGEVLGEEALLTLSSDRTCLMDIAVEDFLYDGTWKTDDAFLILTLTAIHRKEGYKIPVGDMYFERHDDMLICLIDGADEPLTFRRKIPSSPEITPSPFEGFTDTHVE